MSLAVYNIFAWLASSKGRTDRKSQTRWSLAVERGALWVIVLGYAWLVRSARLHEGGWLEVMVLLVVLFAAMVKAKCEMMRPRSDPPDIPPGKSPFGGRRPPPSPRPVLRPAGGGPRYLSVALEIPREPDPPELGPGRDE
jgi:hypothetical protein